MKHLLNRQQKYRTWLSLILAKAKTLPRRSDLFRHSLEEVNAQGINWLTDLVDALVDRLLIAPGWTFDGETSTQITYSGRLPGQVKRIYKPRNKQDIYCLNWIGPSSARRFLCVCLRNDTTYLGKAAENIFEYIAHLDDFSPVLELRYPDPPVLASQVCQCQQANESACGRTLSPRQHALMQQIQALIGEFLESIGKNT